MALRVHVKGIVQGVGFRPFVFCLAQKLGLQGWVYNASDGVHILAAGSNESQNEFLHELEAGKPPAAVITSLTWQDTAEAVEPGFYIRESVTTPGERTLVSPDLATCPDCLSELLDTADRRHHYPFINCTNCGPRFTIIEGLPYDRALTTMADFVLCQPCEHEYYDSSNRRFHAQPNACFSCGPRLELFIPAGSECADSERAGSERANSERLRGTSLEQSDALILKSAELLAEGKILAIKGLGGYHLACDATNEQAVAKLRLRKQRPRKPLAVMVPSLEAAQQCFAVNDTEASLLTSPAAPIVLLEANEGEQVLQSTTHSHCMGTAPLAPSVAGGLLEVGVMLPSTPLQHLLLRAVGKPLVMTSGNISEEPVIGSDSLAQHLLGKVADAFLLNDRPIVSRYDDSVVRVLPSALRGESNAQRGYSQNLIGDKSAPAPPSVQFVRRARGYAPLPLELPLSVPEGHTILAVGPEQKSTFCFANTNQAFLSQHLGDLVNAGSFSNYLDTILLYEQLFVMQPTLLAIDPHPEYLSTKWAHEQAMSKGLPLIEVQHHHAHIAAVIAENMTKTSSSTHKQAACSDNQVALSDDQAARSDSQVARPAPLEQKVIGIALDGTGYGTDGTLWGGEVLIASLQDSTRFAHLECFSLPGGAQAIKHPLRAAYSLLLHHGLTQHPAAKRIKDRLGSTNLKLIAQMVSKGVNSPLTSSAGRYFDAVSALLGVCDAASYEGEPAILLEAAMGERSAVDIAPQLPQDLSDGAFWAPSDGAVRAPSDSLSPTLAASQDTAFSATCDWDPQDTDDLLSTRDLILTILDGLNAGSSVAELSQLFHDALMQIFVDAAILACKKTGIETVALSGGVFNNRYISTHLPRMLEAVGFNVLTHRLLPPNDGCISYGQAAVACARLNMPVEAATLAPCV